jgi:type 1 glutamine amidotransferase
MKTTLHALVAATLFVSTFRASAEPKRVVVCTVTAGFRHSSIGEAEKTLQRLADESKAFTIVEFIRQPDVAVPRKPSSPGESAGGAEDKTKAEYEADVKKYDEALAKLDTATKAALQSLSPAKLVEKQVDAVIFANTTGDLPLPDREGFVKWVQAGHAFIGMHSASDTFHGFAGYREMLQGEFQGHGKQVPADLVAGDPAHPANGGIGEKWNVPQEEVYEFKDGSHDRAKLRAIWFLPHHPQDPSNRGYHAVSWVRRDGAGRIFYTSLGHREDLWSDDPQLPGRVNSPEISRQFQAHILGGIKWALGLAEGSAEPNPGVP